MITVQIKSAKVHVKEGQKRNGGGAYRIREQEAAFSVPGHDWPQPFRVPLGQAEAYEPGTYTLAPESYHVNEYGSLELRRISLVKLGGSSK